MRELGEEQFKERLSNRDTYLYQVGVLATANDNYVKYTYDFLENEIEKRDDGWQLKGIETICRQSSYKYKHKETAQTNSNRGEEWFVLKLYRDRNEEYVKKVFGEILDYQVPLKNKRTDKGVGKVDFIYEKNGELYLAEIKAAYSNESALKAIIEIQTYYQIIDKLKFLNDFGKDTATKIKKSIVLFNGTKGAEQVANNALVKKLLSQFEIEPVILDLKF